MEKITGVALAETWEAMNTLERYKITDQIIQMEKELASMVFPAYGSLYLYDSLPAIFQRYPLSPTLDPEGLFALDRPLTGHGGREIPSKCLNRVERMWDLLSLPVLLLGC